MNTILFKGLIVAVLIISAGIVKGQDINKSNTNKNRVLLNEVRKNDLISLKEAVLYVSAKSLRKEDMTCRITRGSRLVKEVVISLEYGMNEVQISLQELAADLRQGGAFRFQFQARYFGKGSFDFYMKPPAIIPGPLASIEINPLDVNCEVGFASSIEYLGSVAGGTAPYKLTWLVSKGPYIKDLVNPPLELELANQQEVSRLMLAEALDYYLTLLVEDACGNNDKTVIHMQCSEKDNDGMIYFQPIELNKTTKNPGL